jgi:hypothetical protein
MSRRSLQIITGVLATIPVVTGLIGLSGLRDWQMSFDAVFRDTAYAFHWFYPPRSYWCAALRPVVGASRARGSTAQLNSQRKKTPIY